MDDLPENEARRPEGERALETALRRSALAILAERLLRLLAGLATLSLFFLALSWLGLWRAAPVEARMVGVALFGFAALYLFAREAARGLPRRKAAAARLDATAQGPLNPAASLDDTLAGEEAADPATAALWTLHRKRLEAALAATPVEPPQPRLPERDPYALRAFALVAAVAAAFVAGPEKRERLAAAFDWRAIHLLSPAQRIDAWFEPPAYTGRPPIVLAQESGAVEAPVGSTLRLRPADASVSVDGALAPAEGADKKERSYTLTGAANIYLPDARNFTVTALPDRAPTIALTGRLRNNARGSMTLSYRAEDDYGVVSAEAVFSKPDERRALYDPPRLPLDLPAGAGGLGEGRATLDLADSPYAGARVQMRLVAKDAAGNEGASDPVEVTLPQRRFTKPLAKALVEQRRNLALDPEARSSVHQALDALALAPDVFETPSAIHLGLREARRSLEGRRNDDELRGVADMLWAMALTVEDGNASEAERELRAAEQALREAMQQGASEEEIAKRSQELRAALDKFLEQLGARPSKPGEQAQESAGDPDSVTADDLQGMLDDIEKAMKSGDMAQAQKLLDELQDIMENAQTGDESGAQSAARQQRRREMQKSLSELDQLSRQEQQLRDDTFQGMKNPGDDDQRRPQQQRGAKKGQPQAADDDTSAERQRQKGLREKLERQQDALKGDAGEAGESLDDARKAMKEAEEALKPGGEGRGQAVDAQGRAVEALRKGADKLAEQMRGEGQEGQEGEEGDEGQSKGRRGHGRMGQGRDPLGRSQGGQRASHEKYDPLGLPPAQRAHRVQEELRRRLGQPERPAEELDYLQRLLTR